MAMNKLEKTGVAAALFAGTALASAPDTAHASVLKIGELTTNGSVVSARVPPVQGPAECLGRYDTYEISNPDMSVLFGAPHGDRRVCRDGLGISPRTATIGTRYDIELALGNLPKMTGGTLKIDSPNPDNPFSVFSFADNVLVDFQQYILDEQGNIDLSFGSPELVDTIKVTSGEGTFGVEGAQFDLYQAPPPEQVPVTPTLPLLVGGLGTLVAIRRKLKGALNKGE